MSGRGSSPQNGNLKPTQQVAEVSDPELEERQLGLWDRPREHDFDGPGYDPKQDRRRLQGQLLAVFQALLKYPEGITILELWEEVPDAAPTSLSARLRDLRKPRFGGYRIDSWREEGGTWRYKLVPKEGRT